MTARAWIWIFSLSLWERAGVRAATHPSSPRAPSPQPSPARGRGRRAALLGALLACTFAAAHAFEIHDDAGQTTHFDVAPARIVSLLPSLTETVCALGACDRLVGVDRYSNWPASVQKLPQVGGGLDPNVEAVVALKPDVVLIGVSSRASVRQAWKLSASVSIAIAPTEKADRHHAWHLYTLRLALSKLSIDRNRFIEELTARNISTSVHFIPIHHHRFYADKYGFDPEQFPVATAAFRAEVSLPIYPSMTDDDVRDVIDAVRDVVASNRA